MPRTFHDDDLKRSVTPGTISAVISKLREAADETLALADTLTHAGSIADLRATAEALQRDVDDLERIAAAWHARASPVRSDRSSAKV